MYLLGIQERSLELQLFTERFCSHVDMFLETRLLFYAKYYISETELSNSNNLPILLGHQNIFVHLRGYAPLIKVLYSIVKNPGFQQSYVVTMRKIYLEEVHAMVTGIIDLIRAQKRKNPQLDHQMEKMLDAKLGNHLAEQTYEETQLKTIMQAALSAKAVTAASALRHCLEEVKRLIEKEREFVREMHLDAKDKDSRVLQDIFKPSIACLGMLVDEAKIQSANSAIYDFEVLQMLMDLESQEALLKGEVSVYKVRLYVLSTLVFALLTW